MAENVMHQTKWWLGCVIAVDFDLLMPKCHFFLLWVRSAVELKIGMVCILY